MRIFSFVVLFFVSCVHSFESSSQERVRLVIDRGEEFVLSESSESYFLNYLNEKRLSLHREIPDLVFPEKFKNGGDVLVNLDTRLPGFTNRPYHCAFLKKVDESLESTLYREKFSKLFKDGSVCTAFDVREGDQKEWIEEVARFLWSAPWIKMDGQNRSLYDLVQVFIQKKLPEGIQIKSWDYRWDATYGVLSAPDRKFISSNFALKKILSLLNPLDIDKINIPTFMGSDLKKYANERTVYIPDIFSEDAAMYFSPSIGPADLPDVLLHEFGHIFFDLKRLNFSILPNGDILYQKSAYHDEASAESMAHFVLKEIYSKYPEIQVVHILKLLGLGQIRPQDPHFVGAGAVHIGFERTRQTEQQEYNSLIASKDFSSLFKSSRNSVLVSSENRNIQIIEIDLPKQ